MDTTITSAMSDHIARGSLTGVATLVWRDGQTIHVAAQGQRDLANGLPVTRDTIFRIASLTKPITSLAALMLVEEGRMSLDDPIVRWAPEFEIMQVLCDPEGPLDVVVPARAAITLRHLLTHCAGFTYGDFHTGPIAGAYAEALGATIDSLFAPEDWIGRLAGLPLIDQPGAAFHYGHSTDLLGFLLARIEGMPLGEVLYRRIFGPLGMSDTGFVVPPEKHHRRAAPLGFDAAGKPAQLSTVPAGHALPLRPAALTYESGGQGLWSTLDDYLSFARLFVEGGAVDGVRLLRRETLTLFMANQLSPAQRAGARMFGMPLFAAGHGFGHGVAVVMEPEHAAPTLCGGGVGAVGWPGAYGGWWQADPNDASVALLLTHNMVEPDQMALGIGLGIYAAIGQFQALAGAAR
ncbi:MAG TPA: serine hydrolase domain-containing protein [Devosiaceae bacterium]|jgi:CubicO group peptidase (beta-lactamase class C family)|nr:serine hydrolase domain-containing protein [Devosiaceae bacterium]